MPIDRRKFLKGAGQGLAVLALPKISMANQNQGSGHTVVIINMRGGLDHNLFAPILSSPNSSTLTPSIYWPNNRIIMAGGLPVLASTGLTESHPIIANHGSRMSFIHGVSMNGQQGHTFATKLLVTGGGRFNFAQVLAELLGHDSQYGLVSTGILAFRTQGLGDKGQGIEISEQSKNAALAFESLLEKNILSSRGLDDFAARYYSSTPNPLLVYPKTIGYGTEPDLLTTTAINFGATVGSSQKDLNRTQFSIPETIVSPYEAITNEGMDSYRHHGLAFTAARIREGGFSRVYSVNFGAISGPQSYDSHDFDEGNLSWQTRFQAADFQAIGIFLDQIAEHLDNTTVILQSEFGRPPYFAEPADGQGKDHFPECNVFTVFSPLIKNGLHGNVNPDNGKGVNISFNEGGGMLTCANFYRGLLEVMREKNLFNAEDAIIDEIMRQYLQGPYPRDFFNV